MVHTKAIFFFSLMRTNRAGDSQFISHHLFSFERSTEMISTPSGLKITHAFVPYGLSVTDAVLPQSVLRNILDILTQLWYHCLHIGNSII